MAHVRERRGREEERRQPERPYLERGARVAWFPWQHLGFVLEHSTSRLHLHKDYDEGTARLDLNSDGPALYLRVRF